MSIGLSGQGKHAKVKEAELKTIKTALRMNIQPRVEFNDVNEEDIIAYRDLGVKHFCMGPDTAVMYKYFTEEGGRANKAMGREAPATVGYGQGRPGVPLRSTYGGTVGQKAGAKI